MTKYELRRHIPLKIQRMIRKIRFKEENHNNEMLRREILNYYKDTQDSEILEIIDYLKSNPLSFFCYKFADYAYRKKIAVRMDERCGMNYTIIDGKRLYFKKNMDKNAAQNYICSILCEQDEKSPHSYHMKELSGIKKPVNIIDLGGGGGIFRPW